VVGIWLSSPSWAITYGVGAIVLLFGPVVYGLCAHCPYPFHRDQCLFLPPGWVRGLYRYRGPRMSLADTVLFLGAIAVMVLAPLRWLTARPAWLTVFLALAAIAGAAPIFYYCRRCRHVGCPANQVRGARRKEAWLSLPADQ
jgi:hypothetical protein